MSFLTKGYREDADKILRGALFDVDYDEMVIVRDIEVFSLASITCCLFRQGPRGLHPQGKGDRPEQDTPAG
jgi:hypothetical protein